MLNGPNIARAGVGIARLPGIKLIIENLRIRELRQELGPPGICANTAHVAHEGLQTGLVTQLLEMVQCPAENSGQNGVYVESSAAECQQFRLGGWRGLCHFQAFRARSVASPLIRVCINTRSSP